MSFRWLKRYMPRGLYGRAALILVLPVVALQLIVSVIFIQRHFEGVTEQMTLTMSRELRYMITQIEAQPDREAALDKIAPLVGALRLDVSFVDATVVPARDLRPWYDFSGRIVIRTLKQNLPQVGVVQLPPDQGVVLFIDTVHGNLRATLERRRVSASNPHQLLVNMVLFGILMTAVAFIYMRNQLRPITRLARAAEAFGRGQHVPYHPSGAVEVRAAGHAFLDMRARIERQIEQRTLMLSGVSHDLRTPLTRLKLGLAMLDEEDREPLMRDVEDMEHLLDEFLAFARDSADSVEVAEVDPAALVREIVTDAQRAGQNVTFAGAEGEGRVRLRPKAIRRALENLIGNGVRYGTRAEVSVRQTGKSLRIRVEDDGPGIPADQREDAMRPFVRLDSARNQDKGSGVGLGLAIAADITRAHGGKLRLSDSERLGGLCADIVLAKSAG